jgi:hypothetical protein
MIGIYRQLGGMAGRVERYANRALIAAPFLFRLRCSADKIAPNGTPEAEAGSLGAISIQGKRHAKTNKRKLPRMQTL